MTTLKSFKIRFFTTAKSGNTIPMQYIAKYTTTEEEAVEKIHERVMPQYPHLTFDRVDWIKEIN
jgi:hypothetical protein